MYIHLTLFSLMKTMAGQCHLSWGEGGAGMMWLACPWTEPLCPPPAWEHGCLSHGLHVSLILSCFTVLKSTSYTTYWNKYNIYHASSLEQWWCGTFLTWEWRESRTSCSSSADSQTRTGPFLTRVPQASEAFLRPTFSLSCFLTVNVLMS